MFKFVERAILPEKEPLERGNTFLFAQKTANPNIDVVFANVSNCLRPLFVVGGDVWRPGRLEGVGGGFGEGERRN
jgi:hypothetical protein